MSASESESRAFAGKTVDGSPENQDIAHKDGHSNGQISAQNATSSSFKFSKMLEGKKVLLIFCTLANFLGGSSISLLGPFYVLEAQRKGVSFTKTGFVFGIYQIIVFLASPIIGIFMTQIGVKFVYLSGVFVGGCCVILFGLLDRVPGGTAFFVISLCIRFVEALGFTGFMNACMTIVSNEFPDNVGTVMALLKVGWGLGYMFSPVISGFLYEIGGYELPFYCIGILNLLNGGFMVHFLPDLRCRGSEIVQKKSYLNLLSSPLVVISMIAVFLGLVGTSVAISTLSEYLQQFDITASGVGAMYAIPATLFILMTPISGYITDVRNHPCALIVFAYFTAWVSWLLCGPSPLLPFIKASLWTIGIGLFLIGVGLGCIQVPAMKCMIDGALELNYEKNAETYALVSGLFNSAFALGGFTGPFAGGALVERFGFSIAYTIIGFANLFMMLISMGFFFCRSLTRRKEIDYEIIHE